MNVKLNMNRVVRLFAMLAILLTSRAFGQTMVTEVGTFDNELSTDYPITVNVPTFTVPNGQYLTSVQLQVTNFSLYEGLVSATNTYTANETIFVSFASNWTVSDAPETGTSSSNTIMVSVNTNTATFPNVTPGSSVNTNSSPLSGTQSGLGPATTIPENEWSFYVTGGTNSVVTFDVGAQSGIFAAGFTGSGAGSVAAQGTTLSSGTVEVIYTYVPEPRQTASWLLGFGLCLLLGRGYLRSRGFLTPMRSGPPAMGRDDPPPGAPPSTG
jgi:hypothetical protein